MVTNNANTAVVEQQGLPFGTALESESVGVNTTARRFTSYERSAQTGLDYAVNRHYDARQGRFTQVDPIGMSAVSLADPQTLNMYAYCGNDPINRVDPNGLFFGAVLSFIGRAIVGLFGGPGGITVSGSFTYRNLPPVSVSFTNSFNNIYVGFAGVNFQVRGAQPQNTAPTPPTDCQRFADRVAEIASSHNNVRGFVDALARTFIGVASSSINVMRQNANNSTGEYFSSSGFRDGLFDDIRDNQARHFIGGLIAGYNLGATLGATVMNNNENSQADLRVNEISIPLGARLTNPSPARTVQSRARDDIRNTTIPADPGFKALADRIRNQVCAR